MAYLNLEIKKLRLIKKIQQLQIELAKVNDAIRKETAKKIYSKKTVDQLNKAGFNKGNIKATEDYIIKTITDNLF